MCRSAWWLPRTRSSFSNRLTLDKGEIVPYMFRTIFDIVYQSAETLLRSPAGSGKEEHDHSKPARVSYAKCDRVEFRVLRVDHTPRVNRSQSSGSSSRIVRSAWHGVHRPDSIRPMISGAEDEAGSPPRLRVSAVKLLALLRWAWAAPLDFVTRPAGKPRGPAPETA